LTVTRIATQRSPYPIGPQATAAWVEALPLLRLQGERIVQGRQLDVTSPNMFAGSVLDLEPDTVYEVRFRASDPDGVTGEGSKVVRVRTRPEPMPAKDGRTFHVYPPNFKGAKLEPSFEGLMCAYNLTCAGTDWATAGRPRCDRRHDPRPRRPLQVQPSRVHQRCRGQPHGTARRHLLPHRDGTPERPIVIKGAGDGEVVFDGAGNFALFDVKAADYTYFEGITFRNADYRDLGGDAVQMGAKG
jgi:hypothetical protein